MAPSTDHSLSALANRLDDYAEAVDNPAMHQLELDLRDAAKRLREIDEPIPVVPRLIAELKKAALFASDVETRTALRAMLGELAS